MDGPFWYADGDHKFGVGDRVLFLVSSEEELASIQVLWVDTVDVTWAGMVCQLECCANSSKRDLNRLVANMTASACTNSMEKFGKGKQGRDGCS